MTILVLKGMSSYTGRGGWDIVSARCGHVSGKGSMGGLCGCCLRNTQRLLLKTPNLIAEQMDPGILQAEPSPEGAQDRAQPISKTIRPSEK